MSSTHEGGSDGHGPSFMGLYAQLLIRYLRVPPDALGRSLREADIEVDMLARPVFLNDRPTRTNARQYIDPHCSITFAVTT